MNRSINEFDCISAAKLALQEFDHDDEMKHNDEIQMGAAAALYTKLALALFQRHSEEEILLLCESFSCLLLCSEGVKVRCVDEIGADLITLLLKILKGCLDKRINDEKGMILEDTLSIFAQLSFVPSAETILSTNSSFSGYLKDIITDEKSPSDGAKADALALIVNLSFSNETSNFKSKAVFLNTLISLIHQKDGILFERALATLCHISQYIDGSEGVYDILSDDKFIEKLGETLKTSDTSNQEYSAGILNNISASKYASNYLAKNQTLLDIVLEIISKGESKVEDRTWSCLVHTLTNLINPDTASVLVAHSTILDKLCLIATRGKTLRVREIGSQVLKLISINLKTKLEM